jgi:hypothetical protein
MDVQHSCMVQNECLPSRDRTAGLKITIKRDLLFQLQSCALPAELRRVVELNANCSMTADLNAQIYSLNSSSHDAHFNQSNG